MIEKYCSSYWSPDQEDFDDGRDYFSCHIAELTLHGMFNDAAECMRSENRLFNPNAGFIREATLLHTTIVRVSYLHSESDRRAVDFLMHYGADPNIQIDYPHIESGRQSIDPIINGGNAFDLARRMHAHEDVRSVLAGKRPVIDFFKEGLVERPLPVQIGPQRKGPFYKPPHPSFRSIIWGLLALLFSTAFAVA